MTVEMDRDGNIRMSGVCAQDDAEPLLRLLLDYPEALVDWRLCETAHAAVIQLLLAAEREILGPPRGEFLKNHLARRLAGL